MGAREGEQRGDGDEEDGVAGDVFHGHDGGFCARLAGGVPIQSLLKYYVEHQVVVHQSCVKRLIFSYVAIFFLLFISAEYGLKAVGGVEVKRSWVVVLNERAVQGREG